MEQRQQELYDMIRDIQEKVDVMGTKVASMGTEVAVMGTELKKDHDHLSGKVDNHVHRFDKFKDEMEAQFGAISNGFMQIASKEETKKEISAARLVAIIGGCTVFATLLSGILAVLLQQWIGN